jgi:hypothetical protein
MRAKMALVLHLGGVGKCGRLIWDWSVQAQESGDLQFMHLVSGFDCQKFWCLVNDHIIHPTLHGAK